MHPDAPRPETIDHVIERLDDIVSRARRDEHRGGYFAVLYRNVTVRVKDGILSGRFQDGPRMDRLDVRFANRYLDAYAAYTGGRRPTKSWNERFCGVLV